MKELHHIMKSIKKRKVSFAVSIVITVFSLIVLNNFFTFPERFISPDKISLFIVEGLFFFLSSFYALSDKKFLNKRSLIISALIAVLFSLSYSYGFELVIDWKNMISGGTFLKMTALLPIVFLSVVSFLNFSLSMLDFKPLSILFRFTKIRFIIFFSIAGVWILYMLADFPGYWGYDSVFQLRDFLSGSMNAHHPVIHTYMLGHILTLGKAVFGSYRSGLLIYTLIQITILDYAVTKAVLFASRYSPFLGIAGWVFVCVLPFNGMLAVSCTKDVLFSAFFLLLSIDMLEITGDQRLWTNKWYIIKLIFVSILVFAFRNNGIYVFAAVMPFFIFYNRKVFLKALIVPVIVVTAFFVYTIPIYSALNISQGSVKEVMSVPSQQLSFVYNNENAGITEEQKKQIETYIPNASEMYIRISDSTKNTFNTELFNDSKTDFLKLWFDIGIQNPKIYINAFSNLTLGFWFTDMKYPDYGGMWHPLIEWGESKIAESNNKDDKEFIEIEQTHVLSRFDKILDNYSKEASFQKIPVLSLLCKPGIYSWLVFVELFVILYRKKYKAAIGVLPAFFYLLTCMLGPVCLMRYAYPFILVSVTMLAPVLSDRKKNVPVLTARLLAENKINDI